MLVPFIYSPCHYRLRTFLYSNETFETVVNFLLVAIISGMMPYSFGDRQISAEQHEILERNTQERISATGKPVAFFDVDNTLIRGASLYQVGKKMYRQGAFSFKDALNFGWKQLKFQIMGENLNDVQSVRDSVLGLIEGVDSQEATSIGDEVFEERLSQRIWPGTQALAESHLANDHEVWLVTATPIQVADVISNKLNLSGSIATEPEIIDGKYTGKLHGDILHGDQKAYAVEKLATQDNISLPQSWAYSDSYNDLPLLHTVGNPVAINPDKKLRGYAQEQGWPIYDFRSGRKAATLGLRVATVAGLGYGLWKSFKNLRSSNSFSRR